MNGTHPPVGRPVVLAEEIDAEQSSLGVEIQGRYRVVLAFRQRHRPLASGLPGRTPLGQVEVGEAALVVSRQLGLDARA